MDTLERISSAARGDRAVCIRWIWSGRLHLRACTWIHPA